MPLTSRGNSSAVSADTSAAAAAGAEKPPGRRATARCSRVFHREH